MMIDKKKLTALDIILEDKGFLVDKKDAQINKNESVSESTKENSNEVAPEKQKI